MTLPLVPAVSQWDGSPKESENCTCASAARLLLYATGKATTGGQVRAKQSDQSGGTSIPDVLRGLANGWSFTCQWAAPNDGLPIPQGKQGDYIGLTKLRSLLADGFMVIVQGDYGDLPWVYREQKDFTDDHAFTVDAYSATLGYYVVDTLPRFGSGYDGRWVPASALHSYAYGLAGSGRFYAAWAKPLTPPDTGADFVDIYSVPGLFSLEWPAGTSVYPNPAGASSGKTTTTRRFIVMGQDKPSSPTRYLVDGGGDSPSARMSWLPVSTGVKRQNLGAVPSTAAVEVTLGGVRYIGNVTQT